MNYSDQVKTPEWQKKQLYVLHRDNYTCYLCGYRGSRLKAHNLKLLDGKKLWDYPDELLFTVCFSCLKTIHKPSLIEKQIEDTKIGNIIRNGYK